MPEIDIKLLFLFGNVVAGLLHLAVAALLAIAALREGWILPDGELAKIAGIFNPRENGGYVMPSTITPAVMLICKHCSNIRFFAELVMANLIKGAGDDK